MARNSAPGFDPYTATKRKQCGYCKRVHPSTAFALDPSTASGLSSYCRVGFNVWRKAHRKRKETR